LLENLNFGVMSDDFCKFSNQIPHNITTKNQNPNSLASPHSKVIAKLASSIEKEKHIKMLQ
jgi:hypothetical protein